MLQRVETAYVAIIERAMNTAHDEADQRQLQIGVAAGPTCSPTPATPSEVDALRIAVPHLLKLDRYMQRALVRHRRAMRAFFVASVQRTETDNPSG